MTIVQATSDQARAGEIFFVHLEKTLSIKQCPNRNEEEKGKS